MYSLLQQCPVTRYLGQSRREAFKTPETEENGIKAQTQICSTSVIQNLSNLQGRTTWNQSEFQSA